MTDINSTPTTNIGMDTTPTKSRVPDTLRGVANFVQVIGIIAGNISLFAFVVSLSEAPAFFLILEFAGIIIFPLIGILASARLKSLAIITEAAQLYRELHTPKSEDKPASPENPDKGDLQEPTQSPIQHLIERI